MKRTARAPASPLPSPSFLEGGEGEGATSPTIAALLSSPDVAAAMSMSMSTNQQLDERLLAMEAILGLIPNNRPRTVDDRGADLFAAMGRQAMHE